MCKILLCLLLPFISLGSQTFTATTNTLLATVGSSLPSTGSVSIAFNPSYSQSDGVLHYIYETDVAGGFFRIIHYSDNNLYFQIVNGTGNWGAMISTYVMPTGTWAVVTASWTNGAGISICFNAVQCSTSWIGGSLAWSASNTVWSIGNTTSGGNENAGLSALIGVWNRVLTSDEVSALSLFYSPSVVASSGLLHDWNLSGSSLIDSVGGVTLAASGTTTGSDQAPLFSLGSATRAITYASFF